MFIKKTKSKNYTYLQIVKSYRDSGKVRRKVVANLGRFDKLPGNPELIKMLLSDCLMVRIFNCQTQDVLHRTLTKDKPNLVFTY